MRHDGVPGCSDCQDVPMIDGGTTKVYTHYCTVSAQAKHIRIIDHVCLAMRLGHPFVLDNLRP